MQDLNSVTHKQTNLTLLDQYFSNTTYPKKNLNLMWLRSNDRRELRLEATAKILLALVILLLLKITMPYTATAQTAGGGGIVWREQTPQNIEMRNADVELKRLDTEQTYNFTTNSSGIYFFENIDLSEPLKKETPKIENKVLNYTTQGQDHNITTPKTNEPGTIYTIQGQAIAKIQAHTQSNYSHFYWKPNNIPAGTYIFTTTVNGQLVSQKLIHTNSENW